MAPKAGLALLIVAICVPLVGSSPEQCVSGAGRSVQTALLLQKKGPEVVLLEYDPTTGSRVGFQSKSIRLQGAAFAGFTASDFQRVHFLPTSPPLNVTSVGTVAWDTTSAALHYENASLGSVANVWNVEPWESTGHLFAVHPAAGYSAWLLRIDVSTGAVRRLQSVEGVPVRGLHATDRAGDRYWFLVSRSPGPALVTYTSATDTLEVAASASDLSTLVGLHYDDASCTLLGFFLRAPGLLGMRKVSWGAGGMNLADESGSFSPAAGAAAQPLELVGMTRLVAGEAGPLLVVRDPHSSTVRAFEVYGGGHVSWEADDIVGTAVGTRLRPAVASVSPGTVGMAGGGRLTITGSDFGLRDSSPMVSVGGAPSAAALWESDTRITALVPPTASDLPASVLSAAAQVVNVTVAGVEAHSPHALRYVAAWRSVDPSEGSVAGGTRLTVSGGRFAAGYAYACRFGGGNATEAERSNEYVLFCTTPKWDGGAGNASFEVLQGGAPLHADGAGTFAFTAGAAAALEVAGRPWYLRGGEEPAVAFSVAVVDDEGNRVVTFAPAVNLTVRDAAGDPVSAAVTPGNASAPGAGVPLRWSEVQRGGVAVFGGVSVGPAGNFSFEFRATGVPPLLLNVTVYPGPAAALRVELPPRAVASSPVRPIVRVAAVDLGGNVVEHGWNVTAMRLPEGSDPSFVPPTARLAGGRAELPSLTLHRAGASLLNFTAGGLWAVREVEVLPGAPSRLYSAVAMPSSSHPSMRRLSPPPSVRVLDAAGNHISGAWWSQGAEGGMQSAFLDVNITASLVTAFSGGLPQALRQSSEVLPSGIISWEYHMFGTTEIRLRTDPSATAAACPNNCSGPLRGACGPGGVCACLAGFEGAACEAPSGVPLCGAGVCASGRGWYVGEGCDCAALGGTAWWGEQVGPSANFTDLLVDTKADGYVLLFAASGLGGAQSLAFSVVEGAAQRLWLISQPYGGSRPVGGFGGSGLKNAPIVAVRDGGGNIVRGSAAEVSVSLVPSGNGAALSGENVTKAVRGLATFDKVSIDLVGEGYRLRFESAGLVHNESDNFTVTYGPPASVVVGRQPGGGRGGEPLLLQPSIEVRDAGGNLVRNASVRVTATLVSPPGAGGGRISSGALVSQSSAGAAEFTDLAVDLVGQGYRFNLSSDISWELSDPFDVSAGSAWSVEVLRQPSNASGGLLRVQPAVRVYDRGGNLASDGRQLVNVSYVNATGLPPLRPAGSGYSVEGTGVVNFTDLAVAQAGPNMSLVFFSGAEVHAGRAPLFYSAPFDVVIGDPFSFDLLQHPASSWAGEPFSVQPSMVLRDRGGNVVPIPHRLTASLVTASPLNRSDDLLWATSLPEEAYNGTGCRGAWDDPALRGALEAQSDGEGLVRFTNLNINVPARDYRVLFSSPLVQGGASDPFHIVLSPAAPTGIRVVCAPFEETAAVAFRQQPVVDFVDRGGNRRHLAGATIEVAVELVGMGANATLTGTPRSVGRGDAVSFTNLAIDKAGSGFVLRFSSPSLSAVFSPPFAVNPSGSAALSIRSTFRDEATGEDRRVVEAGEAFGVDVFVVDRGGNVVNDTRQVSVELWRNYEETRSFPCQGDGKCTAFVNATVPAGARLVAASASVSVRCTDFDHPSERITAVSVASVPLAPGPGFDTGPWPDCARSCGKAREVLSGYDIVRDICWSTDDTACARLIVADVWDPEAQTKWDFYQAVLAEANSELPVVVETTSEVNFHPCDGGFLSADVTLRMEYATPIGAGDASLSGATATAAAGGIAAFGGLTIDKSGARYTIKASAPGMVPAYSFGFLVIPGPVSAFAIVVQPGNGTGASPLAAATVVDLYDGQTNRVDSSLFVNATLLVEAAGGALSPAPAGSLTGTAAVRAVNGRASFTDLFVGKASALGEAYRLNITSQDSWATTDRFWVSLGPARTVGASTQPAGGVGGAALATQPVASPLDLSGNVVWLNGSTVTASIAQNGAVVGELSGTLTSLMVDGFAAFTDLRIDRSGEGYTLSFSMPGLLDGESQPFNVARGAASQLLVVRQPLRSTVGQLMTAPQPAVAVADAGGNTVTGFSGTLQVQVHRQGTHPVPGMQAVPASLLGTTSGYLSEGVFYFWDLRVDQVGLDIVLNFTSSPALPTALSDPFSVYGGDAVALSVVSLPSFAKADVALPEVLVAAVDANGNVDANYAGAISASVAATSGGTFTIQATQGRPFTLGIASFTDLVVAESGVLSLNFSSDGGDLRGVVGGELELVDAWTGWWKLWWPVPSGTHGFSMRREGERVEAAWTMSGGALTYASAGPPLARAGTSCQQSVGQVFGGAGGEGSFMLDNCGVGLVNVTAAMRTPIRPQTRWARDAEYFEVQEQYPSQVTRRYLVVANSYDGSSYATDSALYEWSGGQLSEVTPSPFQNTKGAHHWKHFVMGGAHYLVVANHYDDGGNGYGSPSVIYKFAWSSALSAYTFTPVQSISTAGAAAWEAFDVGEDTYLAVANYFNGSHFDVNSKVFKLARTDPDTPLPRVVSVQSIPTSGARCVEAFQIGGIQHLAYGNRRGGDIKVYRWDATAGSFALWDTIISRQVLSLDSFTRGGKVYLAAANLARAGPGSSSDTSAVWYHDPATMSGFAKLQDLTSGEGSDIKHFTHAGDDWLAVASLPDGRSANGSSQLHRWSGGAFWPVFDLPTDSAYALAFFTVPCDTTASDGLPCGQRATEDLIFAANGGGVGSQLFRLEDAYLSLEATHAEFTSSGPGDAAANATLAPPAAARVRRLGEAARSDFYADRALTIDAELIQEVAPPGAALAVPRDVGVLGVGEAALAADGTAAFGDLRVAAAGNVSLRVGDRYLSNVSASMSDRFAVFPGAAAALAVAPPPAVVNASFSLRVRAVDALGNFQPSAAPATVTASVDGDSSTAVGNAEASLAGGTALFPNLTISVARTGIRLRFEAAGLAAALSPPFDVAAPTTIQRGPAGDSVPVLAGGTATYPGEGTVLYVFGGQDPSGGPTDALYSIDTSTLPFTVAAVATSSARRRRLLSLPGAPSPRYDHAAVAAQMGGGRSLLVFGGRNASGALSGAHRLDLATLTWSNLAVDDGPGRARHSAIVAVPTTAGLTTTDGTSTVVVFGGQDSLGRGLGDLRCYRVFGSGVSFTGAADLASGTPPTPRWGAVLAWVNGTGYVLGGFNASGDMRDDKLYAFNLDYNPATLRYEVAWGGGQAPEALAGARPPTPLSPSPAVVGDKVYLIAPASEGSPLYKVYALDPGLRRWLPTVDAGGVSAGGGGALSTALLVPFAEGKVSIFLPTSGSNSTSPLVLSFVPSYALAFGAGALPAAARAGKVLSPPPSVRVLDEGGSLSDGDDATVVTVRALGPNGASLPTGGGATATAVRGIATFTTLSVDRNASGVVLRFSAPALLPASSPPFAVAPGPIARVQFTRLPEGVFAGADFAVQPAVELVDVAGNLVESDSFSTLAAQLERHVAGDTWADESALLTGQASLTASKGRASFSGLGVSYSAPTGQLWRLTVTRSSLPPANSPNFTFTSAAETQMVLAPSFIPATNSCYAFSGVDGAACAAFRPEGVSALRAVAYGGVPFSQQPVLTFELKARGLALPDFGGVNVSCTLVDATSGDPVGGNPMIGTTTTEAGGGRTRFTDLGVRLAGSNYKLRFDTPGATSVFGPTFAVTPGPPNLLQTLVSVEAAPKAGADFARQPSALVVDAGGNNVTVAVEVTARLIGGGGAAALAGNTAVRARGGTASFTDLSVAAPGTGYRVLMEVGDACCGVLRSSQTGLFDVVVGDPYKLEESVAPAGAVGGASFATQPVVRVLDAGGNLLTGDSSTVVTAEIGQDNSLFLTLLGGAAESGYEVLDIEPFSDANGTRYLAVARNSDGSSHRVNSTLWRWNETSEELLFVQEVPSLGAWDFESFAVGSDVFVAVANNFREVASDGGVPLGTYSTQSFLFKLQGGFLVFAATFDTHGAAALEAFSIGSSAFLAVANSFDGDSRTVPSEIFRITDLSDDTFGLNVQVASFQQVASSSARGLAYVVVGKNRYLAVANHFQGQGYAANSSVLRFTEGLFAPWELVETYGAVAVSSFHLGADRAFLAFASALSPSLDVADGGVVDVYEFDTGGLVRRQRMQGLHGVQGMSHFRLNQADWLALPLDPPSGAPAGSRAGLLLALWNTSSCASPANCAVNFTEDRLEPSPGLRSASYFPSASSSGGFLAFTGSLGVRVAAFRSLAGFTGPTTATAAAGLASFSSLGITLAQGAYRMRYTAPGLLPADGASFPVAVGAAYALEALPSALGSAEAGAAFPLQPAVRVVDLGGNVVASSSAAVTASLLTAGALGGLRAAAARSGVAAFTDLSVDTIAQHTLQFDSGSLQPATASVEVGEGPPRLLSLHAGASGALGGGAFATQPAVRVTDGGGNWLRGDNHTIVEALLDEPSPRLSPQAELPLPTVLGARRAAAVPGGGGRSFAAVLGGDGSVAVYEVQCGGGELSLHQSLSVPGGQAFDIDTWHLDPYQYLAAAASGGLAVWRWDAGGLRFEAAGGVPPGIPASTVRAFGGYLAVGRSVRPPSSLPLGGFGVYSWDGEALAEVQNVTLGGDTVQMEHARVEGAFGQRDLVVRGHLATPGSGDVTLTFYLWVGGLGLVPWADSDVAEAWLSGGGTVGAHSSMAGFPVFPGGVGGALGLRGFALGARMFPGEQGVWALALAAPTDAASGVLVFGAAGVREAHYPLVGGGAGAQSAAFFQKGGVHYAAFRTQDTLEVFAWGGEGFSQHANLTGLPAAPPPPHGLSYARFGGAGVLLAPANASLGVVSVSDGAAALSGAATARAVNGLASFTDLSVDAAGNYTLTFSPASLRARSPTPADHEAALPSQPLEVVVGAAAALRFEGAALEGSAPVVSVVDAGGNPLVSGNATNVTSRVYNPAESASFTRPAPPFSTTGAKRVTAFKAGGRSFLAVANQYDGSLYNIDSAVYEWLPDANPPSLSVFQQIATSGAYAFTAFDLPLGGSEVDSFLAVANHYDDADAYAATTRVYRLQGGAYAEAAALETWGATHAEAFSVGGVHYLAVANYFDGTFHDVGSYIYRWEWSGGAWALGTAPVQTLPTVAAHHIAFFEHGGASYLAVAQHWDEARSTFALTSPVFRWDPKAGRWAALGTLPTQAALHVEPFSIAGSLHIAVSNSLDPVTGKPEANSTVYRLECGDGGSTTFVPVQQVLTSGATKMRHFVRGGLHHLAVAQWVPNNESSVEVLVWTGQRFERYAERVNGGAFDVEVIADSSGYYLAETLPADTSSVLQQLVQLDGGANVVEPFSESVLTDGGRAEFSSPGAVPASPSAYWDTWVVDFSADGLEPASSGPYKAT